MYDAFKLRLKSHKNSGHFHDLHAFLRMSRAQLVNLFSLQRRLKCFHFERKNSEFYHGSVRRVGGSVTSLWSPPPHFDSKCLFRCVATLRAPVKFSPSEWNNLRTAGLVIIKLYIGDIYKKKTSHLNLHLVRVGLMTTKHEDLRRFSLYLAKYLSEKKLTVEPRFHRFWRRSNGVRRL
jgi:hypothetical protein